MLSLFILFFSIPFSKILAQQQTTDQIITQLNSPPYQSYIAGAPSIDYRTWDVTTQPLLVAQNQRPDYVSTNGYGEFVVGGQGLQLIGNDGGIIGTATDPNYSTTSNTAIATNHRSGYAIITSAIQNNVPVLQVRLSHILPSTAQNHNYGNHNYVSTRNPNILLSNLPPISVTIPVVAGSGASINRIEVTMDLDYVYITWQLNTRRLGYAIVGLANENLVVPGSNVLDANNNPAVGSIPTIACDRWGGSDPLTPVYLNGHIEYDNLWWGYNYHNSEVFAPIHIAYAEDAVPIGIPLDFVITHGTWATNVTQLVQPPNANDWKWVRVCYESELANGVTGRSTNPFFFYGVVCSNNGMAQNCMFSTDGITAIVNNAVNPVTTNLIFDPNINNPIPPMALCDEYQSNVSFGTNINRWLYCVYKHNDDNAPNNGNVIISICTQDGRSNKQDILTTTQHQNPSYYMLGSNEMGTFSLFDDNGTPAIWRNFQSLWVQFECENTIASGLVRIENMSAGVYTDPENFHFISPGDTLRIFGDRTNGQRFFFRDHNDWVTTIGMDLAVNNPVNSTPRFWWPVQFLEDLGVFPYRRAHVIFDNSAQVDFNNQQGSGFQMGAEGSLQYDGALFTNMNQNVFGGAGITQSPDTVTDYCRPIININAPLTLDNGSQFFGRKALVNFIPSSTQLGMAVLSTTGTNTSITCDTCNIYMGSTSKTIPLFQIEMNLLNSDNLSQVFSVTNSNVITNNTQQHDLGGNGSNLSRSDILIKKPLSVNFNNCDIEQVYTEVRDPVSSVNYSNNFWIAGAQDILNINWNPGLTGAVYAGIINVSQNVVGENFPIGTTSGIMKDFVIDGFQNDPSDLVNSILVAHNTISQYTLLPDAINAIDHIGILFDHGSNGAINFNSILNRHSIGIHTHAQNDSRPFVCSNTIGVAGCGCINIGIQQDGQSSINGGYTKINDIEHCTTGYFATEKDQSNLVGNIFENNGTGALFADNALTILSGNHWGVDNFAGFNQIFNNTGNNIELQAQGGSPIPSIGRQSGDQLWGQNIFTLPNEYGAKQMNFTSGGSYTLPAINEVSQNQWSPAINTGSPTTDGANCPNLTYTNVTNVTALTAGFSCGGGFTSTHGKGGNKTLADNSSDCYYYSIYWPDSLCLYEKALTYFGVDAYMCRDSMRKYAELHPFATVSPGEVLDAFRFTYSSTGDIVGNGSKGNEPWINEYNWYVKMQPINSEQIYQEYIIDGLANCLGNIDRNEEANMWYNYTLLFPGDTVGVAGCWYNIQGIRESQSRIPEDTTPFHKLTFPLKPLPDDAVVSSFIGSNIEMSLSPNPAKDEVVLAVTLSETTQFNIAIYDILGRRVFEQPSSPRVAGKFQIPLDTKTLSSGTYYVRLQSSGGILTKQLVVNR